MSSAPKWDPANPVAPFDHRGMQDYPLAHHAGFEWRPVHPFDARMTLVNYERGRSAARFLWRDADGRRWPMFMVDMLDLLQRGEIREGTTRVERWTVVKRGANYGLALAPEADS